MNMLKTYSSRWRSFGHDAKLFIVGAFLVSMGTNMIWLLFNLYMKALGYSESEIGDNLAFRSIGSIVAALPATLMAARGKVKRWLLSASLLNAVAFVAISFAQTLGLIRASGFAIGLFSTVYSVASAPFLMRSTTPEERPFAFSLNAALGMLSGTFGSAIAGVSRDGLAVALGDDVAAYRAALLLGAVFSLVSIVPFGRIKDASKDDASADVDKGTPVDRTTGAASPPDAVARRAEVDKPFLLSDLPLFAKLITPSFLIGFGAGLTIPFINLYFKNDWGLNDSLIGTIFGAGQATTFIGMAVAPFLVHKYGSVKTVVAVQWLSVPFMLALAFLRFLPGVILAFLVRQTLMNMATPINDQFAMERVRPASQPLINALKMLSWTASWAFSASVGGRVLEWGSFQASFLATAVVYVIGTALFLAFFGGKRAAAAR